MGQDTEISWCHHTANLWWGCVEVSKLCDHCYAREWSKRYDRAKWGANEPRQAVKGVWSDLAKYQRLAAAAGEIHRVFIGSMMDIFEKPMPLIDSKGEAIDGTTDDLRQRLFNDVVPACPNLLFLFLSKRPGNIPKYIPASWLSGAPSNVMFGTSVGDMETKPAIEVLKKAPGRRFLSCEPMLGDLGTIDLNGIHWVIVGGESGHGARPMHPDWARSIRDQCQSAGVPFHFKQWGEWAPNGTSPECRSNAKWGRMKPDGGWTAFPANSQSFISVPSEIEGSTCLVKYGKNLAGRMLDGRTWDQFPESTHAH